MMCIPDPQQSLLDIVEKNKERQLWLCGENLQSVDDSIAMYAREKGLTIDDATAKLGQGYSKYFKGIEVAADPDQAAFALEKISHVWPVLKDRPLIQGSNRTTGQGRFEWLCERQQVTETEAKLILYFEFRTEFEVEMRKVRQATADQQAKLKAEEDKAKNPFCTCGPGTKKIPQRGTSELNKEETKHRETDRKGDVKVAAYGTKVHGSGKFDTNASCTIKSQIKLEYTVYYCEECGLPTGKPQVACPAALDDDRSTSDSDGSDEYVNPRALRRM